VCRANLLSIVQIDLSTPVSGQSQVLSAYGLCYPSQAQQTLPGPTPSEPATLVVAPSAEASRSSTMDTRGEDAAPAHVVDAESVAIQLTAMQGSSADGASGSVAETSTITSSAEHDIQLPNIPNITAAPAPEALQAGHP
jgi:type IV secretory pathway TrbL component